jgi:hypothetical protein
VVRREGELGCDAKLERVDLMAMRVEGDEF